MVIVEAYTSLNLTMKYYGTDNYKITHFPFNFAFVLLDSYPTPKEFDSIIKSWLDNMPQGGVANWVVIKDFLFNFMNNKWNPRQETGFLIFFFLKKKRKKKKVKVLIFMLVDRCGSTIIARGIAKI